MCMPDVIGFTLKNAVHILEAAGITVQSVKVTSPPRDGILEAEDYYRVLSVRCSNNQKVDLLVCKPL